MSCEYLKIDPTNPQRNAFLIMWAKMFFTRLQKQIRLKTYSIEDKKATTTPEKFFAPETKGAEKYDYQTDWAFPQCCNQYFSEKGVLFDDFLQEVTELGENKIEPTAETEEYTRSVLRLSQEILKSETQFPKPILQSIQIGLDAFQIAESSAFSRYEVLGLASALTRLFYLAPSSNPFLESDSKVFQEEYKKDETYVKNRFTPLVFLTLVSRQNICPHFSRFATFFTCRKVLESDQKDCGKWQNEGATVRFLHLYEIPSTSIQDWVKEPASAGSSEISTTVPNDTWLQFQLKRPLRLEIQNVLFQISFILYTLSVFNIRFTSKDFTKAGGSLAKIFRIFLCKQVQGYDRYRTLNHVFYVPNYGNFVVLSPSFPIDNPTSEVHGLEFASITSADTSMIDVLPSIITEIQARVDAWTPPPTKEEREERGDYEWQVSESPNSETGFQQQLEVQLLVNEQKAILEYLENFQQAIINGRASTTASYEFYEKILTEGFKDFRNTSPGKQDVSDLILIDDFGFHLDQKKLRVPAWLNDPIFPSDEKKVVSALPVDPRKLIVVDNVRAPSASAVDPEVYSIASSLQALTVSGRYSVLFTSLTSKLAEFLQQAGITSSAITDRYTISATQLDARKNLRQYGTSFLTLLARLSSNKYGFVMTPGETEQWWNAARLSNMFTDATTYLSSIEKSTRDALLKYLKVEQPEDFRKLLTVLMLLSYLQRYEPKPGSPPPPPETSPTEVKTTTSTTSPPVSTPVTEPIKGPTFEEAYKRFTELLHINPEVLQQNLKWIQERHGLPDDVRVALKDLIQKINRNVSRKVSAPVSGFSQSIARENSKQKELYQNLLIKVKSESEQQEIFEDSSELQEEILRTELRLQHLRKQQQQQSS